MNHSYQNNTVYGSVTLRPNRSHGASVVHHGVSASEPVRSQHLEDLPFADHSQLRVFAPERYELRVRTAQQNMRVSQEDSLDAPGPW